MIVSMAKVVKWIVLVIIAIIVVLLGAVIAFLMVTGIPSNGAAMAAKGVCSAKFVADRPGDAQTLFDQDILPASPAFKVISVSMDEENRSVTGKFLGMFSRTATLHPNQGCVLDLPADTNAQPFQTPAEDPTPWPQGDAVATNGLADAGANEANLKKVLQAAMQQSGDPNGINARGIAIAHDGKLVAREVGAGFQTNTPLHGWSMTKSVAATVFAMRAEETGLKPDTLVINAFPEDKTPGWVAEWAKDNRAQITVADLLYMRSGLEMEESYQPWGQVVKMLYGEPNMASWAAGHPRYSEDETRFEYLSAVSNIIAQINQAHFATNEEYWQYTVDKLYKPLGIKTATMETDTTGTQVGSSFLWASIGDWTKLGQLFLNEGKWNGQQVYPASWNALLQASGKESGEGHSYGAQIWHPAREGGECASNPDVPKDTMTMEGHWGQVVASIPSKNLVISRLGWTINKSDFSECKFLGEVAKEFK